MLLQAFLLQASDFRILYTADPDNSLCKFSKYQDRFPEHSVHSAQENHCPYFLCILPGSMHNLTPGEIPCTAKVLRSADPDKDFHRSRSSLFSEFRHCIFPLLLTGSASHRPLLLQTFHMLHPLTPGIPLPPYPAGCCPVPSNRDSFSYLPALHSRCPV